MMNSWRSLITGDGCPTLVHPTSGEPCHDTCGAWAEANQLHVAGCDLPKRLLRGDLVRLLDVGSAPGWNLAAACSIARSLPGRLEITAVERSEEALFAGLGLTDEDCWQGSSPEGSYEALCKVHAALRAAHELPAGSWVSVSKRVKLRLWVLSAQTLLQRLDPGERFDAIFLDSFSPRVDPEAWERDFIWGLADRLEKWGRLTTYTISHPVRAALMSRGLAVGWAGARSGRRGGTWASHGGWVPPLSDRLRSRLERRSMRLSGAQGWVTSVR